MPKPRKRLISLDVTPYYHCISRCVRRSYLCGKDPISGYDFEHRRQWIVDRMRLLSSVFAIDLCAYAVMSNHYHVVIRVDAATAKQWGSREVAKRWLRIFGGSDLVRDWLAGFSLSSTQRRMVNKTVAEWQKRLADVSWFMRCLNEPIARLANQEDSCTGRFWEGRFKSQALLNDKAVLACMAYVDLNPIRAATATIPETSNFTSIEARIRQPGNHGLLRFTGEESKERKIPLPYELKDYLEFVDWAGRAVNNKRRGAILNCAPPILERLSVRPFEILKYLTQSHDEPLRALGTVNQLKMLAESLGLKFLHGVNWSQKIFASPN